MQPTYHASPLALPQIFNLPVFYASHISHLDTMSLQPKPFRAKLYLTIHEALVLSQLAESPLGSELRSLECQPAAPQPAKQAVHKMLDVIKMMLPELPRLEHFHYAEELNQILQIDEDLIRALYGAARLSHLAMGRFVVHHTLYLSKALPSDCTWALTTINLAQLRLGGDNFQTRTFLADLLAAARQSVRALTLDVEELFIRPVESEPSLRTFFPLLQHVTVKNARMNEETARAIYAAPNLRSIAISLHDDSFQDDEFQFPFAMAPTGLTVSNWGSTRYSKSRTRLHALIKHNPGLTHVNIRPVPNSRIADAMVLDSILAPLSQYNKACVSLSAQAGPCLVSPAALLYLSDMRMLKQIRLELQTMDSAPTIINHDDVQTQLKPLEHLRCLIIDGQVESRLAPAVWDDATLEEHQEERRLATVKDDLLALAASYAMTFPDLQVLGINKCWFEFENVAGESCITKAVFDQAEAEKAPYALKSSFRVDEHMRV